MSKIFSFNNRLDGSYIDGVSGAKMSSIQGYFEKTEQGNAWRGDGSNTRITLPTSYTMSLNSSTIVCNFKMDNEIIGDNFLIGSDKTTYQYLGKLNSGLLLESNTNGDQWLNYESSNLSTEKWYNLIIIAYNGTVNSYLNGELIDTRNPSDDITFMMIGGYTGISLSFDGHISKVELYDHPFSKKERLDSYRRFLLPYETGKDIHLEDFPNKPKDLSKFVYSDLGDNIVTNGTFDTATDWTIDANSWVIADGKATYGTLGYPIASSSDLKQAIPTPENSKVLLSYEIVENTLNAGYLNLEGGSFGLPSYDILDIPSTVGKHTIEISTITYGGSQVHFTVNGTPSSGIISIDNISVQQLTGLVAAYNMIPSDDNVLVDISGNGVNAAFTGMIGNKNGMVSSKTTDTLTITETNVGTKYTLNLRANFSDEASKFFEGDIFEYWHFVTPTIIRHRSRTNDTIQFNLSSNIPLNVDSTWTLVRNGANVKLYLNGEKVGEENFIDDDPYSFDKLFNNLSGAKTEIKDIQMWNRVFSEQEIKAYHNQFVNPVIIEDFSTNPVGVSPKFWEKGTGVYTVEEYPKAAEGELVTNGGFDADTGWNTSSGCTITDGKAVCVAATSDNLFQLNVLVIGRLYKITYEISDYVSGNFSWRVSSTVYTPSGEGHTSNGVFTEYFIPDGTTLRMYNLYPFTGKLDNVSVEEIQELPVGTKLLECGTAGTTAMQSDVAYGKWEFDLYVATKTNDPRIYFISNLNEVTGSSAYSLVFVNSDYIKLVRKDSSGATSPLFQTAASYIQNNTWYRIIVERTEDGTFTVYIRSDEDGNFSDWTLVDVSGGSGTNPVTDNTYKTSKYIVNDLDAGDKFTGLKVWNGLKQI